MTEHKDDVIGRVVSPQLFRRIRVGQSYGSIVSGVAWIIRPAIRCPDPPPWNVQTGGQFYAIRSYQSASYWPEAEWGAAIAFAFIRCGAGIAFADHTWHLEIVQRQYAALGIDTNFAAHS